MTAALPLFPLGSVLFPGLVLPLHVFEDRQRLLAVPDTASRLRAERRLLTREVVLLDHVRAVPVPLSELAVPFAPN